MKPSVKRPNFRSLLSAILALMAAPSGNAQEIRVKNDIEACLHTIRLMPNERRRQIRWGSRRQWRAAQKLRRQKKHRQHMNRSHAGHL